MLSSDRKYIGIKVGERDGLPIIVRLSPTCIEQPIRTGIQIFFNGDMKVISFLNPCSTAEDTNKLRSDTKYLGVCVGHKPDGKPILITECNSCDEDPPDPPDEPPYSDCEPCDEDKGPCYFDITFPKVGECIHGLWGSSPANLWINANTNLCLVGHDFDYTVILEEDCEEEDEFTIRYNHIGGNVFVPDLPVDPATGYYIYETGCKWLVMADYGYGGHEYHVRITQRLLLGPLYLYGPDCTSALLSPIYYGGYKELVYTTDPLAYVAELFRDTCITSFTEDGFIVMALPASAPLCIGTTATVAITGMSILEPYCRFEDVTWVAGGTGCSEAPESLAFDGDSFDLGAFT